MQQSFSEPSRTSFCVREQKAIALLAVGASYAATAGATGLSFNQIVSAWRRRAEHAVADAPPPASEERAFRLML